MEGVFIPFEFLHNKDLSAYDALILAYIKDNCDQFMTFVQTNVEIAKAVNGKVAVIPNIVARLNTLGFLDQTFENQKRILIYTYDAPHRGSQSGYIYIMKDTTHSYLKIGFSKNPSYRESTLQGEKPTIELVRKFKGTMAQEQAAHRVLAKYRKRGEWFEVSIEQAEEAIKMVIGL
jgi:hypothetical protein